MRNIYLTKNRNAVFAFVLSFLAIFIQKSYSQVTQTFNSSGSFTVPVGVTSVTVECWGAGGAGGGNSTGTDGAGGGGGGAYSKTIFTGGTALTPGNAYTFSVGHGGTGSIGGDGTTGEDTWFGTITTLLAKGGGGGFAPAGGNGGLFGAGGLALNGIGTTKFSGGDGGTGRNSNTGRGGPGGSSAGTGADGTSGATTFFSTNAAAAPTGGGIGGNGGSNGADGSSGGAPGSGGGGSGDGNQIGGNGVDGRVVITYTCNAYSLSSTSATSVCAGGVSTITLNASAPALPVGVYTVTYNLNAPNAVTGATATMTVTTAGIGSFTTPALLNSGSTTVTITNLFSGIGTGCSSSISSGNTSSITVNAIPATVTVSGAGTYCNNTTLSAANGGSGTIYFQGITTNGVSTALPSASAIVSASGTYYFRAQSAASCWSTEGSAAVVINPLPTAVTVSGAAVSCGSTTITAVGGTGGTIYFQGTTSGGVSTATPSLSQLVTSSGTYYFRAQSAAGCWGTEGSVAVIINPLPTAVTVSGAAVSCGSTTITTAGGTGGTIYFQGTTSGGVSTTTPSSSQLVASSGTYYFRSQTAAGCWSTEGSITVTVNQAPVITTQPATAVQLACLNGSSVDITVTTTGSGLTYQWYRNTIASNSGGTSLGVTGTSANYTPLTTSPGTLYYYCIVSGTCTPSVTSNVSGAVTVNTNGTIALFSGNANPSICINNAISNIVYTIGGAATGATISAGSLPAGVTGSFSGGIFTISGTPATSGVFPYTVTTTGSLCSNPSLSGTITVNPNATLTLSSAVGTDAQTNCINTAITPITYLIGGTAITASMTAGTLPAGVTGSFSGGVFTISGTPSISGVFNYTITATGTCLPTIKTGTITVNANSTIGLSSAAATTTQTKCINTAITNITYTIGGGGTGATVIGLPAGVTGSFGGGTFTISGSPTASGIFNYTVTTSGPCINPSLGGTITVTPNGTVTLSSTAGTDAQTTCINTAITNISYSIGGTGTGGSITAGALPSGVVGSFSGGVFTISGTPTVSGSFSFTVTASGSACANLSMSGTITVNANSTISLSSGGSTNVQTKCINTAISNITYAIGGGGTGATVTGLPAGVTGSFSGGTFTISGSPTASGTFNYTVTATGPCVNPSLGGTITVTADATISLTSAAGTNAQTKCINTAITNITYAIGGSGTGASVSGLPGGVNGLYAAGIFTISGTPTASGVFTYTISTNGPCVKPTATGTITVNANSTISISSGGSSNVQTKCINTAISNITYAIGGGGTGANVTGLPAGVTGTYSGGTFSISGSPTASGTFNYTVTTSGPCINPSLSGTITVTPNGTVTLSSAAGTDAQTKCINTAITNITYTIGGTGTGASVVVGSLPAGVVGLYSGGVFTISGTPIVSGIFNYTVTASGSTCANLSMSGTITVNANSTISLSSAAATTTQTKCINTAITNITYAIGGGGTGATVTGLPAGVTGSYSAGTFTISGSPTASGTFSYIVTASGPCINPALSGTITVTPDATISLSSAAGTNAQTKCINNAITNITYAIGGSATGASVLGLPAGVNGVYSAGVFTISGTPTVSGTFNYTVSTTGPCVIPTATGTITVNANSTISLSSAAATTTQTKCINTAITNITYAIGGGGTGATVTGLPAGVTGSFSTGTFTISGSPTASGTFNYTVTASGPCINPALSGTITVTPDAIISLSSAAGTNAQTKCINTAITNITYAIGGSATGATVAGLPAGVSGVYSTGVFTISGTPTASGVFNYTVSTAGPCVIPTATGTITVNANSTISLSSAAATTTQTKCINTAITNITYAIGGGGTGATVTGLPAGVTGSFSAGTFTISGSPTASGTFNYTVTASGPCINPALSGTITVTPDATISLSSAAGTNAQTKCINTAITNITYAIGGSATGATVAGLPAGVSGVYSTGVFTISGTPTASGVFNYTVSTAGPCVIPTVTGTITVNANSTISLSSAAATTTQTKCINTAITNITYAIGGGGTGAIVTGLPAGVTGSYSAGTFTISGSPTVSGTFTYTVTSTGPCITPAISGTITVTANATITLSSAAGTNAQTKCINTAISPITYSIGGSGSGASITAGAFPAGVTGTYSGGVYTISGTPTVSGSFSYTITTGGACVNPTATGTITVTADATIVLNSAAGTDAQTKCINTAITNITYLVGGGGTSASLTLGALPAGVAGTYNAVSKIFTINGTPTVSGVFNYTISTAGACLIPSISGTITITANSTITLSSAAGTNAQTKCINNAITPITYSIGGSGTGASITAGSFPAGVTGSYSGGVYTISGTPTVSGVFNYTITTAGACVNPTATGTITVNADASIVLSSAAGTNAQNVCISTAMTNITYAIGAGGTGASITSGSLPAGVTGVYNSGSKIFTISGTPTVAGNYSYTITTTGTCVTSSASGSITVNANSTLGLTSAAATTTQTLCQGSPITNITYAVGGGATGASVTGLPAGLTGSYAAGVFTISGTPTVSGSFNYTVTTTGPCVNQSLSGTFTLNAIASGALIASSTSICPGNAVSFTAPGGYAGYIFRVNGTIVQNGLTTIFNTTSLTGGELVTVEIFSNGCSVIFTAPTVTVNSIPTPSLIADKTSICPGGTITFTAGGGASYAFKVNGATVQNGPSNTYSSSTLSNGASVTVAVSNAAGCAANSGAILITVNALPGGTLTTLSATICQGDNAVFTATGGSSYQFKVNGVIVQVFSASNTYSTTSLVNSSVVTVDVVTAAGCAATYPGIFMTVNDLPAATLTASENSGTINDNHICSGSLVSFTATAGFVNYNFKINGVSGQSSTSNIFNTSTLANNDIVTVDASNSNGCIAIVNQVQITVDPLPAGSLIATATTICQGTNIIFTATAGHANYHFKVDGVSIQSSALNTYSNSALNNGAVVSVEVAGTNGCSVIFNNLVITVNNLPVGALAITENSGITSNDFIICAGAPVTFTATAGFSNYKFLLNGSTVQNNGSNTYSTNTINNNDVVSVEITNAAGCKTTVGSTAFTVNAMPPVAAITGTAKVCVNATSTLSTTTTGGVWSSSNTAIATVNSGGVVTGVAAGVVNISYTVTNAANCTNNSSVSFTVNALPVVAAITGSASVCVNQNIVLGDVTTGGSWSSSNTLFATVDAVTGSVFGVSAGTVTIGYTVSNGAGCTTMVTKSITINALPVLSAISGANAVCVNSTITLSDATAGGTWSSSSPSVATISVGGVLTGLTSGSTIITYTLINGSGCTSAVTKTVTVNALPVPTLTGPNPICQGSTGNVYTTEAGQFNYNWVVTNGTITGGGTSTSNTITISWLAAGAKNITVNYSNSNGCVGATSATVANAPSGSLPTLTGPSAVCVNSTGNVYTTEAAKSFYTWTVTGGSVTSGGTSGSNTATVTWNTVGSRSVSINYSDAFGCNAASPTVYPVTVNPVPAATIGGTATVCKSAAQPVVTFTGSGGTTPYTFTYKLNGGANQTISSVGSTATISVNTSTAGTFTYTLVSVQDASATACSQLQSGTATITVNALPTVVINTPATICSPSTVDLTAATVTSGSTTGLTFSYWTDAAATSAYPTPANALGGTYYIKGTNVSGCYDIKPVVVTINTTGTLVINNPAAVCSPSTVNITVAAVTTGSTASYTLTYWTNPGATVSFTTPTTAANGTYYIKGTTAAGCFDIKPVTVTVNLTPTVVINTPAAVCLPATVDLTAVAITIGSTAGLTYTYWTDAAATAAYATPITASAGTYYIKGTTASGCYNIKPVTVTINASPTVVVTNPAAVCSPTTVSISAAAVTAGSTASLTYTYWTDAAASLTYVTPTAATAGTYYIKGTNASGCYNIKPVVVTINPLPTVVINTPAAVCSPATIDLTASAITFGSTAGLTYTYWTNAGATIAYGSPTTATAGTYYIKGTTASGCIDIKTVTVTVNALPTAPVITPVTAAFCIGSIQTLTAGSAVVWSPNTDLFTDAAATVAYAGQSLAIVYAKPATSGTKVYTATVTSAAGCSKSATSTLTVNSLPVITVTSDYCIVPGKVRLTATAVPAGASFLWNNGMTASVVDVDIASIYSVTATYPTGCSASSTINVSVELVSNGDFSAGNTGFFTEYTYTADIAGNTELYPEGYYAVGTNANNYHNLFFGKEHTTPAQTGNFMIINGSTTLIGSPARQRTIWQQTVAVQPNTNYYFSAYAMNVNPGSPAKLQFEVNGVLVGTIADLSTIPSGNNPTSSGTVNINNWLRFYSNPTWASGSATTAVIRIINLNSAAGGNDFALDDISFSTLSTFIKLLSATGTDGQAVCANAPLTDIVYSVGSGSTGPIVSGLPSGVTSIYNGVNLTITGSPATPGSYVYTITTTGTCNPVTATGAITVQEQTIGLTSGTAVQTVCKNAAISNIVYTIGGTATNATISGLPAGVSMTKVGNAFTIAGTPTVSGTFIYTITTSGSCAPVTTSGSLTVQTHTISYLSGNTAQVICFNSSITNINYNVGGTATGATVTGLPAGVTGVFNSGFVTISGKPTVSGVFNYTVTTSGSCSTATAQISGSITVNALTSITLSAGNATQPYCVGSTMFPITYNIGGAATNATVSGLPAGVTGVYNSGVLTISGTPTQSGVFSFTVNATGSCGISSTTGTLSSGVNTWTGNVSTNWSDANNWSCGAVPITVTDVLIPTSAPRMPQLTATSVSKSIVLQTGTILDLNGQSFTNYGAVTGAGKMKGSLTSSLTNDAAGSASIINFDQTTDGVTNALKNLTIIGSGSSVTINTKAAIYGTLTPTAGTLNLTDTLVLRSISTGTARVDQVGGAITYSATGKVSVERYYPMSRSWRLVTTPLSNTGSILNNWQAGGSTIYDPGKAMFITGPSPSGAAGNGLDYSGFNNYSMKGWNAATGTYINVGNTKTRNLSDDATVPGVPANIGYYAFVRGDRRRSPDNTIYGNMNNTTLSATGKLQTGTQTFTITSGAGTFPLIGNPYASSVDFAKITKNNVNPYRFYVFDPSLGSVGLFVVMEDPSHTGNFMPISLPTSTQRNFIQSSQAFFVQVAGAGAASVVFDENDKATDYNPALFRPQTPVAQIESIRTTLLQLNPDNTTLMVDGVLLQAADAYNDKVDIQDALKFTNINENLGMMRNSVLLSVERRQLLKENDTIYLYLAKTTQRKYRLEFAPTNVDPALTAYLEDSFTGLTTPLSVTANSTVDFNITADSKSAVSNRFRIVFKQTFVGPLPVTFKTVKAYQKVKDIAVEWTVDNEINIKNYEVERSADGVKYERVNTTIATGANRISTTYNWLDVNPLNGNNFYRIRSIEADGRFDYSNTVLVKMGSISSGIRIYPNPVTDGIIGAEFKNMSAGIYSAKLLNAQGQTVLSKTINHAPGTSMENIKPDYKLLAGIYQLEITSPAKEITIVKVIVK